MPLQGNLPWKFHVGKVACAPRWINTNVTAQKSSIPVIIFPYTRQIKRSVTKYT